MIWFATCIYQIKNQTLDSCLKQWNLLHNNTKVSFFRIINKELMKFFTMTDQLCYCCDIKVLILSEYSSYKADDWQLFVDFSKMSLKAVLCIM